MTAMMSMTSAVEHTYHFLISPRDDGDDVHDFGCRTHLPLSATHLFRSSMMTATTTMTTSMTTSMTSMTTKTTSMTSMTVVTIVVTIAGDYVDVGVDNDFHIHLPLPR